jgi:hypothetical protein
MTVEHEIGRQIWTSCEDGEFGFGLSVTPGILRDAAISLVGAVHDQAGLDDLPVVLQIIGLAPSPPEKETRDAYGNKPQGGKSDNARQRERRARLKQARIEEELKGG